MTLSSEVCDDNPENLVFSQLFFVTYIRVSSETTIIE